jgi:hypothetical protein
MVQCWWGNVSEQWALLSMCLTLLQVCRYRLGGSYRMEAGHTQRMLFWTSCMTLSTHVSSQTDFPIVSNVDRTGPPNSPDLNPWGYFLWGLLKEKTFPKKPETVMELRALITEACNGITEDMCRRVSTSTVRAEEVSRRNGGHTAHLIHKG